MWNDTREGTDVLCFFAALYTICPASVIDALRGGAIENNEKCDHTSVNLLCVPGVRTLQRYMAPPFPVRNILTVSRAVLREALQVFSTETQCKGHVLAATVDCVYGESRAEILKDIDGKNIIIGGALRKVDDGAVLDCDQVCEKFFDKKSIATKLMTVVLHSLHTASTLRWWPSYRSTRRQPSSSPRSIFS